MWISEWGDVAPEDTTIRVLYQHSENHNFYQDLIDFLIMLQNLAITEAVSRCQVLMPGPGFSQDDGQIKVGGWVSLIHVEEEEGQKHEKAGQVLNVEMKQWQFSNKQGAAVNVGWCSRNVLEERGLGGAQKVRADRWGDRVGKATERGERTLRTSSKRDMNLVHLRVWRVRRELPMRYTPYSKRHGS